VSRRIAIVGTREPTPQQCIDLVVLVAMLPKDTVIVSGAARGVDRLAADAARKYGLKLVEYPADWNRLGKSAGFQRNQTIVDDCDEVHAFPGAGNGTWDTVRRAKKAGKTVTIHETPPQLPTNRSDER